MDNSPSVEKTTSLTRLIHFVTGDKRPFRGRVLRLTTHGAVISLPASPTTVRPDEVLEEIEITLQHRTYQVSKSKVKSAINTGVDVICELVFTDPIATSSEVDEELEEAFWNEGVEEFSRLTRDFQKLPVGFKGAVLDLESFFVELKATMDQFEIRLRAQDPKDNLVVNESLIKKRARPLLDTFNKLHERLEIEARKVPMEDEPLVTRFLRQHLQPFFLCSPFGFQTCVKPLGYAGDYQSVNMIVENRMNGETLFGKFMNWLLLSQAPSEAHRNRIDHIFNKLVSEAARVTREGRRIRILSIGCGPACEIQRFLDETALSNESDVTLVDFNEETLAFAQARIEEGMRKKSRTLGLKLIKQSVVQFLKRVPKFASPGENPEFDLVYCAGLLDYFNDRMCRELINRFHKWTADEGLLMVTNVATYRPFKYMLDSMLEWHLQYRDSERLKSLAPDAASNDCINVLGDDTFVNLFLEIRKQMPVSATR